MMALGKVIQMTRKRSKRTRYPGVHNHGDGTFRLRGRVTHKKTGQKLNLEERVPAGSPEEARDIRARMLAELAKVGPQQTTTRPTLRTYADTWFLAKQPSLKASTQELYATVIELYILRGPIDDAGTPLGDCYVDAIELEDLVQWRDRQMAIPTKYGTLPRPDSVNGRIARLREIMQAAVHDLRLERDPTLRLEPVRRGKKRRNSLTADELARFLKAAREHTPQWYPFFYALAFTGLRFGELTQLRWRDIDEAALVAHVGGSQWKGIEDTTKTDEPRDVALVPEFVTVLHEHRELILDARRRKAKRERVSVIGLLSIHEDELVFTAPRSGKHMHNTAPRRAIAKCLKEAGIERRFTIHGHRHTANNLLRQTTKDGTTVRAMMGHAEGDGSITDRYSHVELSERREAVANVVSLVGHSVGHSGSNGS